MLDCAVLFLVFNRPEATSRVFHEIRKAKPKRLYVAADGHRDVCEGELEKVALVRNIASQVDWDCEVKTLFRDKNIGCKRAVSGAITWFFEHEEEGIILEDDCLPNQTFFPFCKETLERYRTDSRIMMISGDNFQINSNQTSHSYYFSRYTHVWGWATWRRAWEYWDGELSAWPEVKNLHLLKHLSSNNDAFEIYWGRIFDKYHAGEIDTWDYPWLFSCWIQHGLTILPKVNLVSNIGFGEDATHTHEVDSLSEISSQDMNFPLIHPTYVVRDFVADQYTESQHYKIPHQKKAISNTRQNKSILSRLFERN